MAFHTSIILTQSYNRSRDNHGFILSPFLVPVFSTMRVCRVSCCIHNDIRIKSTVVKIHYAKNSNRASAYQSWLKQKTLQRVARASIRLICHCARKLNLQNIETWISWSAFWYSVCQKTRSAVHFTVVSTYVDRVLQYELSCFSIVKFHWVRMLSSEL